MRERSRAKGTPEIPGGVAYASGVAKAHRCAEGEADP